MLNTYGAILFRGFSGLATPDDFEDVATAVSNLMDYVGGTSPRRAAKGHISTSTEAPPWAVIPQHQEMSYTSPYPDKVMFFCEVAPSVGGQTPLADMRAVTARLPVEITREFERRGLRLVRELGKETNRVGRRVWPEIFATTDRGEVERIAELRPAMVTHPRPGDRVWFNQAHLYGRSPVRNFGRWLAGTLFPHRGQGDCVFGDGAAIPFASVATIRNTIHDETTSFDWQKGDVLLIDNILVAHGRKAFEGPRCILAALIQDLAPTEE